MFLLQTLGKICFLTFFQSLDCCILWLMTLHPFLTPASVVTSPASLFEDPCGYIEPTQIIQGNLPLKLFNLISSAKSLLLHKITSIHRFWGLDGHLGSHYSVYQGIKLNAQLMLADGPFAEAKDSRILEASKIGKVD